MCQTIFYGWWVVTACLIIALVSNAAGFFGIGVYLHAIVETNGWTIGLVSGAVSLFYVVSALLLMPVGSSIARIGARTIMSIGGAAMAVGIIGIGHATMPWHVYLAFLVMGVGWACTSSTSVATTLAPWFERYQARAISIAMLGASAGGIIGGPILLFAVERIGLVSTTLASGLVVAIVVIALSVLVIRDRPEDMGLTPDGLPALRASVDDATESWTRLQALKTAKLRTVVITFGIAMGIQVGFFVHQVSMLAPVLNTAEISATVAATAVASLAGRLTLSRFGDRLNVRLLSGCVLTVAALTMAMMGVLYSPVALIAGSIVFGLTIGNVTVLSPIIVRREFGARSFGTVFGVASSIIQLGIAAGPSVFGQMHDMFGSYRGALLLAAALDFIAAVTVVSLRRESALRESSQQA